MIILLEQILFVKSISGNSDRIRVIRFNVEQRFIIKIFYKFWINLTNKEIGVIKLIGKHFIIASSILHHNAGFIVYGFNKFYKLRYIT